ncbi:acyltransferase [Capnocytophaga canis]|uniref:acyltransferase n=1 Tax=Capnocytophaga canis TaxID=1848903 RepID=UPI00370DBD5E
MRKLIKKMTHIFIFFDIIWNYFMLKFNSVSFGSYNIRGRIQIRNGGKISIGEKFSANSGEMYNPIGGDSVLRLICSRGGELRIGKGVGMSNSTIVCRQQIIIEDYVLIGGGCRIWDTNFHSLDADNRIHFGDDDVINRPILIKKYAFIGGGSIILKGVTIGKKSIIAAGSVVTRDVPDFEVWGGNPARFIKKL